MVVMVGYYREEDSRLAQIKFIHLRYVLYIKWTERKLDRVYESGLWHSPIEKDYYDASMTAKSFGDKIIDIILK